MNREVKGNGYKKRSRQIDDRLAFYRVKMI